MNVEALLKAKDGILENPEDYDQNTWEFCIAGWVARLNGIELFLLELALFIERKMATKRIIHLDEEQWERLVFIRRWPVEFITDIGADECCVRGSSHQERAETAARRIDRYIATEGRE